MILRRRRSTEREPLQEREATGLDLRPRPESIALPPTVTRELLTRPTRRTQQTSPPTPIPTNPAPPPPSEGGPSGPSIIDKADKMTLRSTTTPFGGFSGPTSPSFPTGGMPSMPTGGGTSIWDRIGDAVVNVGTDWLDRQLGGGSEAPSGGQTPGSFTPAGPCAAGQIRGPGGICISPTDALPGGDPFITGGMTGGNGAGPDGYGAAVRGRFGVALQPRVEARTVRKCPPGMKLGKDNLCYDQLRKSERKWDPGMKPLMTGGDRKAIRKAERVASKLKREQKRLKKASRALEKAC